MFGAAVTPPDVRRAHREATPLRGCYKGAQARATSAVTRAPRMTDRAYSFSHR